MDKKKKPKYAKPTKSKLVPTLVTVAAVLAVVLIALALFVKGRDSDSLGRPRDNGEETTAPAQIFQEDETDAAASAPAALQFPYALKENGLEITSLFQYTGFNPDCRWSECTNIGAVVFTNNSGKYLETLELTMAMTDGSTLTFRVCDIPAGKTAWAFELNNQVYDTAVGVQDIQCGAAFRDGSGLGAEQVTVSASAMEITLTNSTDGELSGLEIRCHDIMDDVYFGGTSYAYSVGSIAPGGSTTVLAADCLMGEAGVALIDYAD